MPRLQTLRQLLSDSDSPYEGLAVDEFLEDEDAHELLDFTATDNPYDAWKEDASDDAIGLLENAEAFLEELSYFGDFDGDRAEFMDTVMRHCFRVMLQHWGDSRDSAARTA